MTRIHLIAPAGSLQSFYRHLGFDRAAQMVALFQEYIGPTFQLTANSEILDAEEDEFQGGRIDDDLRARDIMQALGDDAVAAILSIRGGAWFTRILPKIDFRELDRRSQPITVFGFSELTPLINIVANHPMGRGYHDMGPAFLVYGLRRFATLVHKLSDQTEPTPDQWMAESLHNQLRAHLQLVAKLTSGTCSPPSISARLVHGSIGDRTPATFVGGNLTVLSTLIGSPFAAAIASDGNWLVLEDFNDKLERLDRFLAHFTLAGYWNRWEGLLLGDFHRGESDLLPSVIELLRYHIESPAFPILTTSEIGHIWPMTPLAIHHPGVWRRNPDGFQWHPDPIQ